jgi:subtilisin family serine protease
LLDIGPGQGKAIYLVPTLVSYLSSRSDVQYAQPVYLYAAQSDPAKPSDRDFMQQWGLCRVQAPAAWKAGFKGNAGAVVAVVDSGYHVQHGEFPASNLWTQKIDGKPRHGKSFCRLCRRFDPRDLQDLSGHGTHMAGIIGAAVNNEVTGRGGAYGIAGINWYVQLMMLRFLNSDGKGDTVDAAEAICFAADHGAHIVNASWGGGCEDDRLLGDAIRYAGEAHSVLVVAAAGNEPDRNIDQQPFYPASFSAGTWKLPNVLAVGATGPDDFRTPSSSYGPLTVAIGAPGGAPGCEIYSTWLGPKLFAYKTGSSAAAAFVSGAAAVVLGKLGAGSGYQQVIEPLLAGADRPSTLGGCWQMGRRLNLSCSLDPNSASCSMAAWAQMPARLLVSRTCEVMPWDCRKLEKPRCDADLTGVVHPPH